VCLLLASGEGARAWGVAVQRGAREALRCRGLRRAGPRPQPHGVCEHQPRVMCFACFPVTSTVGELLEWFKGESGCRFATRVGPENMQKPLPPLARETSGAASLDVLRTHTGGVSSAPLSPSSTPGAPHSAGELEAREAQTSGLVLAALGGLSVAFARLGLLYPRASLPRRTATPRPVLLLFCPATCALG